MQEKIERLMTLLAEARGLLEEIEKEAQRLKNEPYGNVLVSSLDMQPQSMKTRVVRSLDHRGNITTIGQLLKHSSIEISGLRNMGWKGIEELKRTLREQYNIYWQ